MSNMRRRGFLRAAGAGVASVGLLAGVGSASASVTLSGRLLAYGGDPIPNRFVYSDAFETYTDEDGRFSATVEENDAVPVVLHDHGRRDYNFRPNEVPLIYSFSDFEVETSDRDIGDIPAPPGRLVDVRALDADGNPVEDATVTVEHDGYAIGPYFSTNAEGWGVLEGADFRGFEAAGEVKVTMSIPTGGGEFSLDRRITADGPKTMIFRVGSGVTVRDGLGTPTPTRTPEPTATPPPEPTATGTPTPPPETTTPTPTPTGPSRGFFGNGGSTESLGPLSDPFVLTVGGFALSVAGIAHQMIRGY